MIGEIEESSGLDFKVNSGSISFGRFESESLCWERRSSFSHNRYLEEVERHSKPGSVTEKKAYFEAHFKKKGILGLLSPGIQSQKYTENEEDNRSNDDEHSPSSTDESSIDSDNEKNVENLSECGGAEEVFEQKIEPSCNDSDISGCVSGDFLLESSLLRGSEIKDEKIERNVGNLSECGGAEEVFEPKIRLWCNDSDSLGCVRSNGGSLENSLLRGIEIKEDLDCGASKLGCKLPDSNESNNEITRSKEEECREKTRKEKVTPGDESRVRVNPSKGTRKISGEVSKTSGKKLSKTVNDVRSKKASSDAEKARKLNTKAHAIKRAENDQRSRAAKPQYSSEQQRESSVKVHQPVKRVGPVSNISRPSRENPKIVTRKINADIPKKEREEAELKQSRKGLNFKARPLPSFYRRAASHDSDTSKEAAKNKNLQMQRCDDKKSSSEVMLHCRKAKE